MLRQDQLRTLRQTHQTASTVMPLVTAGLALMSALLAAQERRTAQAAPSPERQGDPLDLPRVVRVTTPRMSVPTTRPITPATPYMAETPAPARERRPSLIGSIIRYVAALVGAFVTVVLGAVAVIGIVALYVHLERSNRTALLTVLIVSVLYLTARVARSRQRRSAGR